MTKVTLASWWKACVPLLLVSDSALLDEILVLLDRVLDSIQAVHDGIHGFRVRHLRLQHLIRHRIDAVRLAYGIQAIGKVLLPNAIDAILQTLDVLVHPALVLIVLALLLFDPSHRLHDLSYLGVLVVLVEFGASHICLDRLLET